MTDDATQTEEKAEPAFEPFPAVAGVGWRPALVISFLGMGSAVAVAIFVLHPIFIEDPTSATGRLDSTHGVMAAVIGVILAVVIGRLGTVDGKHLMRLSAVGLAGIGVAGTVSPDVDWQLLLVAGVAVWVPGIIHHRAYLTDLYAKRGHFRVLGLYWSGAAIGAAAPLLVGAHVTSIRADTMSLLTAVTALGLAASFLLPKAATVSEGIETTSVGWPRRSRAIAAVLGVIALVAVPEMVELMDMTWEVNEDGRVSAVGGAALALIAVLLFGHWYHRLEDASPERATNVARLAAIIGGLLLIASAYSVTLIGMILAMLGAVVAIGLTTVVVDFASLSLLTTRARRVTTASQLAWFLLGGLAATLVADSLLSDWTPRSIVIAAVVPLLVVAFVVGRGTRKHDTTHSDAIRKAAVERTAVEATSLLALRSVDVAYGSVQVLFDIDFEVVNDEIVALLGTNGAGKTTLLRTISGLEQPTNGRIVVGGADVTDFESPWMTELGVCHIAGPESIAATLTVEENLRMFAHSLHAKHAGVDARIDEAYELFPRLGERRGQRAATLSGGEKQMLALAKAVILSPRVLLIDEFSLGLAPKVVSELLPAVRKINEAGTAIVLVEQNVATALSIADRAYVIEKGEMLWSGDARILRENPQRIEQMYLTGVSEAPE